VQLNQIGEIVENTWREIPIHFPYVTLDSFVIMPNHVHGILNFVGARHKVSRDRRQGSPLHSNTTKSKPQPLGVIVGSFKSAATKHIHRSGLLREKPLLQRNYYEHIIRDDEDYRKIYKYIELNPINWEIDHENLEK